MNRRLAVLLSILALLGLAAGPAGPRSRGAGRRRRAPAHEPSPIRRASTPRRWTARSTRASTSTTSPAASGWTRTRSPPTVPLERLREDGRGQPALPLGDAGGGRPARRPDATPTPRRSATTSPPAWTRRPSRRRGSIPSSPSWRRSTASSPGPGSPPSSAGCTWRGHRARCSSASAPARTRKNASQVIGFAAAGRPRPPVARGLHQGRRQVQGGPRALPRLRAEDLRAAGRSRSRRATRRRCCAWRPPSPRRPSPRSSAAIPTRSPTCMKRKDLQALTPAFHWDVYLKALGQPGLADFNVTEPKFFQELSRQLATSQPGRPPGLPPLPPRERPPPPTSPPPSCRPTSTSTTPTWTASKQISPRWKRCACWIDRDLGRGAGRGLRPPRASRPRSRPTPSGWSGRSATAMAMRDRAVPLDEPPRPRSRRW